MNNRYQFLRFPGGKIKAVTFSYDDAVRQDIRLADIFCKHGMKATFNLNSLMMGDSETHPRLMPCEVKEHILDRGHEIATHGANHRAPLKQRPIEVIRDTLDCRLQLEEMFGCIIRGMAYPDSGIRVYSSGSAHYGEVREYLSALDIAYSRTLGGDNDAFELPEDFYSWMPSAHHNNPRIFEFIDKFLNISDGVQSPASRQPRLFYIWGHSYEFDNNENWDRIEQICEKLGGKDDTWYATNIEIYDYVHAYESLIYSANGTRVYNPSLFSVWIWVDGKIFEIKSGETITIG